jgi:3-hydroxypropanoate dehydrogenase
MIGGDDGRRAKPDCRGAQRAQYEGMPSFHSQPQSSETDMVDETALDVIFRAARTHNVFLPKPVADETLHLLYDLMKFGPTSANASPGRLVFLKSPAAKDRLGPALSSTNRDKTLAAPVVCIVAHDLEFYEQLPKLFPHNPTARSWFAGNEASIQTTAFRNGTLQGAYMMLAARAVGLDCGPMSGFDNAKVDAEFFPEGKWKSNFLCNLGYGDAAQLFPRNPRLEFAEACRIL